MDSLQTLGIQLIQGLQTSSPAVEAPMGLLSFLGTIEFYLLLIPFLYWLVDAGIGFRVLLVVVSVGTATDYLKQLLHQPRPYWMGGVKRLADEFSYGIPSGHSSSSIAIWGFLAYRYRQRWLWTVVVALVLLVGLSRVYLAVHFPHDVLAGWLLGVAILYLFVEGEKWALPWLQGQTPRGQIAAAFGASVGLIIIALLVRVLISGSPDIETWAPFARQARELSTYFTNAGALFGGGAGFALMRARARFHTGGPWPRRGERFLIGIVGVLIVWLSLDMIFSLLAEDETVLGYILRYIRYALTAFWATFGAPALFLRFKLAEPAANSGAELR